VLEESAISFNSSVQSFDLGGVGPGAEWAIAIVAIENPGSGASLNDSAGSQRL
jgi:hypothetical protein